MKKDKFKVKWSGNGWGLYHSKFGILWTFAGDTVYQHLEYTNELCRELNLTGKCPDSWFEPKKKKATQ